MESAVNKEQLVEAVYARCAHDAVGIALQVTRSRQKAEDAVQEAAIELLKRMTRGSAVTNPDHMFLHMVRQQAAQLMKPRGHRHSAANRDKDSLELPVADPADTSEARYLAETFVGMGHSSGEYSRANEPSRRFEYVGSIERFVGEIGTCPCGFPATLWIEKGYDRDRRENKNISFEFKAVQCSNGHRYYEGRPKTPTLKRAANGATFSAWTLKEKVAS